MRRQVLTNELLKIVRERTSVFDDADIRQLAKEGDVDGVLRRARELHQPVPLRDVRYHEVAARAPRPATDSSRAAELISVIDAQKALIAVMPL